MTPAAVGGQFGDTTYTKVFVGGLAWETQKDTMKKYFEQFGEILEAVVITDKNTGRSKGYGFVTFREADAAMRACVNATPVIDGRRANCNLASLGVQRSKPSTPKNAAAGGVGGRNIRVIGGFHHGGFQAGGGVGAAFASAATFPHYCIQQGIPYNPYGYSPYSAEYAYPTEGERQNHYFLKHVPLMFLPATLSSYYGFYGGGSTQYPVLGSAGSSAPLSAGAAAYYPFFNFNADQAGTGAAAGYSAAAAGYGVQYPHHLFQYSAINSAGLYSHHYGATMSLGPSSALQSAGVTMALSAPIPHH